MERDIEVMPGFNKENIPVIRLKIDGKTTSLSVKQADKLSKDLMVALWGLSIPEDQTGGEK